MANHGNPRLVHEDEVHLCMDEVHQEELKVVIVLEDQEENL